MPRLLTAPALALAGAWMAACATATQPQACGDPSTGFPDGVCLDLSAAGSLMEHRSIIEAEVGRTLDLARPLIGVSDLRIQVMADPSGVIPEIGLGGYNPSASEVQIFGDPSRPDIEEILREALISQLAHEIHHAMRRRAIGYGSTLLQAAVSEGLADHFALEVEPAAPLPWTTALESEELARWTPEVVERSTGSYDHARWFFGTDPEIPRWTGYAVGFALVGTKLEGGAGVTASALVGEPAASFVPSPGS